MSAKRLYSWRMVEGGRPLVLQEGPLPEPGPGEVLLTVIACGLCHTDYAFLYGGVRPNAKLPLTLGHEIVGRAIAAGEGAEDSVGKVFVVPAVLPCGECELCLAGRGNVCRGQKMPGNDLDGGFASHFLSPARYLCPVPDGVANLEHLSVVADAVGTSYQAVLRSGMESGDLAIVVGAGGVGAFAAQSAKQRGARVVAIDIDPARLAAVERWVDLPLNASDMDTRAIRKAVAAWESELGLGSTHRKIFECSGSGAGQETAWALLAHNATLVVVGFTLEKIPLRLSNLMAFDARAIGNWGCLPEHFPPILELVAAGGIELEPFVEGYPMSRLNELLAEEHHSHRPILIPDF